MTFKLRTVFFAIYLTAHFTCIGIFNSVTRFSELMLFCGANVVQNRQFNCHWNVASPPELCKYYPIKRGKQNCFLVEFIFSKKKKNFQILESQYFNWFYGLDTISDSIQKIIRWQKQLKFHISKNIDPNSIFCTKNIHFRLFGVHFIALTNNSFKNRCVQYRHVYYRK